MKLTKIREIGHPACAMSLHPFVVEYKVSRGWAHRVEVERLTRVREELRQP